MSQKSLQRNLLILILELHGNVFLFTLNDDLTIAFDLNIHIDI